MAKKEDLISPVPPFNPRGIYQAVVTFSNTEVGVVNDDDEVVIHDMPINFVKSTNEFLLPADGANVLQISMIKVLAELQRAGLTLRTDLDEEMRTKLLARLEL